MRLYFDRYICSDCGAPMHLEEGARICPYCGGKLYRVRSGAKKTAQVCRAAAKLFLAVSFPVLIGALAADSGWVCLIGSFLLGAAAWCRYNGTRGVKE